MTVGHDDLTGEDRCWPCTVANSVVGLLVALVPLAAALLRGDAVLLAGALVWALVVVGFTGYRLVARGHLPLAEVMAKVTGLDARIGPESETDRRNER